MRFLFGRKSAVGAFVVALVAGGFVLSGSVAEAAPSPVGSAAVSPVKAASLELKCRSGMVEKERSNSYLRCSNKGYGSRAEVVQGWAEAFQTTPKAAPHGVSAKQGKITVWGGTSDGQGRSLYDTLDRSKLTGRLARAYDNYVAKWGTTGFYVAGYRSTLEVSWSSDSSATGAYVIVSGNGSSYETKVGSGKRSIRLGEERSSWMPDGMPKGTYTVNVLSKYGSKFSAPSSPVTVTIK